VDLVQVALATFEFLAEVVVVGGPCRLLSQGWDKAVAYDFPINLKVRLSLWELQGGHVSEHAIL